MGLVLFSICEAAITVIHVSCLLVFVFSKPNLSPVPSPLVSSTDTATSPMDRAGTLVSYKAPQQAIIRAKAQPRTADWHFCHVNVDAYDVLQKGFTVQASMK